MSQTIPNIKSFEDACAALGIAPGAYRMYLMLP
jgi:hypothetical protein